MYSYEYANATSGWMKNGYFLDYMGNSRLRTGTFSTTWETLGFAKRAMLNGINSHGAWYS